MLATCQRWIDSQFFEAHTWCPTSNSHRAQLLKRSVPSQLLTAHTGKHTNTHLKSCTRTWEKSGSECEPQLNRPCNYITFAISVTKHRADIHQRSAPQCHSNLDLIVKKETVPYHDVMMTAKSWILTNSLDWIEKIDHPSSIHLCLHASAETPPGDHIGFSMQSALAPTLWGSNPWLSPAAKGKTWKNLQWPWLGGG